MSELWTRRRFLRATAGATAGLAGLGLYAWQVEPHWVQIVERPLPLAGLPRTLRGATLVQLSDLHAGHWVSESYLIESLDRAAALRPDFVVFTGDFITYRWSDRLDALARVLEHLPRGRIATVAALGNHDYGFRWSQGPIADAIEQMLQARGATVLRNRSTVLGELQFIGVDDLWAHRFHPSDALASYDPERPTLALCHNPDAADHPAWREFQGWILAGHTHGGQCKPPFLPPPLLPVRNKRYTAGPFDLAPGRWMYINRGLGHLTQVRFNVRPEITRFVLTS
ncbi:MAG TPA: metallophosphoesterase [Gemmatimonadales bacterium]|jgi:predicted MPP superfamily phosphohydrolase